jgi:hypothetical protein
MTHPTPIGSIRLSHLKSRAFIGSGEQKGDLILVRAGTDQ